MVFKRFTFKGLLIKSIFIHLTKNVAAYSKFEIKLLALVFSSIFQQVGNLTIDAGGFQYFRLIIMIQLFMKM